MKAIYEAQKLSEQVEGALVDLENFLRKEIPDYSCLTIYTGESGTYFTEIHLKDNQIIGSNGFEPSLKEALKRNIEIVKSK
jgi:hypothetical protein